MKIRWSAFRVAAVLSVLSVLLIAVAPGSPPVAAATVEAAIETTGTGGSGFGEIEVEPSPADPDQPIADAELREAVTEASTAVVAVEVLTAATDAVQDTVEELGGTITGTVDGEIVQAQVPADRVDELALSDGVGFLRSPQPVSRPPTRPRGRGEVGPGFGMTLGQNIDVTNAAAWQAAGVDGSVKVGIIDYFDFGLWNLNTAESGPLPDAGHRFCLDNSGVAPSLCDPAKDNGVNDGDGFEHGVAVAEVIRDMAPAAELFAASAGTASDLKAAIDWFAQNGVSIITRSLGAAYDGPGDGTGPLAAVVDYAATRGITWFNSTGNDAVDGYARVVVPADLGASGGYVDFDNGPGIDTYLRLSGDCVLFDGVRWNDWDKPVNLRTDYLVEAWVPTSNPDSHGENYNPPDLAPFGTADAIQANGAPPLEIADLSLCPPNTFGFAAGISYIRIQRKPGTSVAGDADILEIALGTGYMELGRSQAAYSAAKPVVDSRNPQLIAVGAVDPANGSGSPEAIALYSSQGPTNDGRVKPDVSAPSCVNSTLYSPRCFNGTSAASPSAAGMAALLLDAGVALPGAALAAAVRNFTFDRNVVQGSPASPDGPDNKYGIGQILLPAPPPAPPAIGPAAYQALTPTRILDTRSSSPVGPAQLIGKLPPWGIVDVPIAGAGPVPASATAVAVNITSTDSTVASYIQAVPYLRSPLGTSSTLNVATPGAVQPNFAIVPIGAEGKITVYTVAGGNIIIDVLGYFSPPSDPAVAMVAAGRLVAIDPVRTLDTRRSDLVPAGWTPHVPSGESVVVPAAAAVPATGVSALVLNVTSSDAKVPGFLRAEPTGTAPSTSTVNYVPGAVSANTVIVPLGANGTVSVFTSGSSQIVVDITGYITDATAAPAAAGRFVPIATGRAYDSRGTASGSLASGATRTVQLAGLAAPLPVVPGGAAAVSINLTAADEALPGFLTAYPAGGAFPSTSTLNFAAGKPVANGAILKVSTGGALDVFAFQPTQFIIDVNGYFTG